MRGDEARVVDAFARWLESDDWIVEREVEFVDLLAERNGKRLYVEAKGNTAAIGLDVDTMYGQILRRMPLGEDESASFAVVVPERARQAALRVPDRVREMLRLSVYCVSDEGVVNRAG